MFISFPFEPCKLTTEDKGIKEITLPIGFLVIFLLKASYFREESQYFFVEVISDFSLSICFYIHIHLSLNAIHSRSIECCIRIAYYFAPLCLIMCLCSSTCCSRIIRHIYIVRQVYSFQIVFLSLEWRLL